MRWYGGFVILARLRGGCGLLRLRWAFLRWFWIETIDVRYVRAGNQVAVCVDRDLDGTVAKLIFYVHDARAFLEEK